ncbi:hypothetical protein CF326_g7328 [Tilletia indica]|nr:hypothetical protein CF326_g7328 [Tilletia indica]
MWSQQISKRPLVFNFAFIAGLLALSAQASLVVPRSHHSDVANLLPRVDPINYTGPGNGCTPGDTVNPCLTTCDPNVTCINVDTCGHFCTLIPLGGSGCNVDNTFQECAQGGCISGTCSLVPTGGICYLNRNCASGLCSEDGMCIDPKPQSQLVNQICSTNTQCLSNDCAIPNNNDYNEICRRGPNACEDVLRCGPYQINQRCASNAECAEGACSASGTCQYLGIGGQCTEDGQCRSQVCLQTQTSSTCDLISGNGTCSFNEDCATKACVNSVCRQSSYGQTCRDARDCVNGNCDSRTGTCLASAGATCTNNAMCASKLCENGKCSKSGYQDPCATSTQCMSGSCTMQFTCGPYGCYFPSFCDKSPNGSPCVDTSDCGTGSSCSGSVVGSNSGTCITGTAPAGSVTTTRTATSTLGSSTTSVKPTSTSTSTKPATTATTSKSTTTSKATTTTTKVSTASTTTTKATSTTALPSAAACTANAVCKSGYCRKALLSDGVTRAATGVCDTKKASGARCYQNGGCISGTCDKTKGVCV